MDAEIVVWVGFGAIWWKNLALDMKLRYSLCLFFSLFFHKYTAKNVFKIFPFLKIRTISFILVIFFSRGLKGHMGGFTKILPFWPQKVPVFPNGHIFSRCFLMEFGLVARFIWNRRGLA